MEKITKMLFLPRDEEPAEGAGGMLDFPRQAEGDILVVIMKLLEEHTAGHRTADRRQAFDHSTPTNPRSSSRASTLPS